jgi:pyruvate formate lyase activating enzyme
VEKKPLFHLLPGSRTYSIATVGCNFDCLHCQNHEISQYPHQHGGSITGGERSAESVVEDALENSCASISYTYVEPTIFYEFAFDCARLAHERQLKNIFVSNGYMTPVAGRRLAPLLDGINIDLKGFTDDFYRKICRARLQPVLDTIRLMHDLGVWVEVTTLLIPGLNDSAEELQATAAFIHDIDPAIPWHVTAFYPTYKMLDKSPTPSDTLQMAADIGREQGLLYVYEGNRPGRGGENTLCPSCGRELIVRQGFALQANRLDNGHCTCGRVIKGVWI